MTTAVAVQNSTKSPRRRLTLADRIARIDRTLAKHERVVVGLRARRRKLIDEAHAVADSLKAEAQRHEGAQPE